MNSNDSGKPEIRGFEILRPIGKGGMGQVWSALQIATGREVAIKCPSSDLYLEKFQREMVFGSLVQHKQVVPVYQGNMELEEGPVFFAMRLILAENGVPMTAREWVTSEVSEISNDFFRNRTIQLKNVSEALGAIHRSKIIHGDIKLDNLLVDAEQQLHITDFGLADFADQEFFGEGTSMYVSPDQARGETTAQSDIYSLGVTSAIAYGAKDKTVLLETLRKLESKKPCQPLPNDFKVSSFCPDAPAYLKWIVEKATKRNPKERYQNTEELCDDFANFLEGNPSPDDRLWWLKQFWVKLKEYRIYVSAFSALLLIAALLWQMFNNDFNRRRELIEQALVPLRDGDADKARSLLKKALEGYDYTAPLEWKVFAIRSEVGKKSKEEILEKLTAMRAQYSADDKGFDELSLLYADYVSCDKNQNDIVDWRKILSNLRRQQLPAADRYYLDALKSDDWIEIQRNLNLALSLRPFHDRASELLSVVKLILGQIDEAEELSIGQLKNKPSNATFACVKTVAGMISSQSSQDQIEPETFDSNVEQSFIKSFRAILPKASSTTKDQEKHWSQEVIGIQRQIQITGSVEKLIRQFAGAHPEIAVPIDVLEARANEWSLLSQSLEEASKSRFSRASLEKLKPFAESDPDGFSSLLMSMIISNEVQAAIIDKEYEKRGKEIYSRFLVFQETAKNKASIVPSQAFRYFNLFMQTLTEFGAINEVGISDPKILQNLKNNTENLVDMSRNVPSQMRRDTLAALLGGSVGSAELAIQKELPEILSRLALLSFTIADDWAQQYPKDAQAFMFRAYFLNYLGQQDFALMDLEVALNLDEKLPQAKELQQKILNSQNKPRNLGPEK